MRPASLLLLLLASLLLQFQHHHRAHADCELETCGNLTVRYPFWLGSSNQSSSPCGHPAFEVLCSDDGSTTLKGSTLQVRSINYTNNSFVALDTRTTAGNGGVCRASFNMSDSIALLSAFTISHQNRALCFLFMCNGTEPRGHGYVNATSNCNTPIFAYLGGSYNRDSPPVIATGHCIFAYTPVFGWEAEAMTAANYSRLLNDGFILEWATTSIGDCSGCTASGGQCRYNNAAAALACLCPDGNLVLGCRSIIRPIRSVS